MKLLLSLLILLCSAQTAFSAFGFVVAKSLASGEALNSVGRCASTSIEAEGIARKWLEQNYGRPTRDYNNSEIVSQTNALDGHSLNAGWSMLVLACYTKPDGTGGRSYGMGVSSISYEDATEKALQNLARYDSEWAKDKKKYGFFYQSRSCGSDASGWKVQIRSGDNWLSPIGEK